MPLLSPHSQDRLRVSSLRKLMNMYFRLPAAFALAVLSASAQTVFHISAAPGSKPPDLHAEFRSPCAR
jgi:hypothetical protein